MEKQIDNCDVSSVDSLVVIPYEQISAAALEGILEEFITREGTNYGFYEHTVKEQLAKAKARAQSAGVAAGTQAPAAPACGGCAATGRTQQCCDASTRRCDRARPCAS